jgi:hypothetical protein
VRRYWRKEKIYCKARLDFKPGCKAYVKEGKPEKPIKYAEFKRKVMGKLEEELV